MAKVDYEAAWIDLSEYVASKGGHGTKDLHAEMAAIAAKHRVPEDLIQKVIRLYGSSLIIQIPETGATVVGELRADDKLLDPGASTPDERGTDEQRDRSSRTGSDDGLGGSGDAPASGVHDGEGSGRGSRSGSRSPGRERTPTPIG